MCHANHWVANSLPRGACYHHAINLGGEEPTQQGATLSPVESNALNSRREDILFRPIFRNDSPQRFSAILPQGRSDDSFGGGGFLYDPFAMISFLALPY